MKMTPPLGAMVRGLRLGFGWYSPCQAFIRIEGSGPFKFEFHPPGLIPHSFKTHKEHRCWWPSPEDPYGLPLHESPFIRSLKKVKLPFIVYLDDNGNPVSPYESKSQPSTYPPPPSAPDASAAVPGATT